MKRWIAQQGQTAAFAAIIILALTGTLLISRTSADGPAALSLSSAGAVRQGETLTVTLSVNSPDPINLVEPYISYDPAKLEFKSMSVAGPFKEYVKGAASGGIITGAYGTTGQVSGSQQVATLSFTAKISSGSAALSFTADTFIGYGGDQLWNENTAGTSYSFTSPPPAGNQNQGGNQSQNNSPAPKPGTPSNPTTPTVDDPVPVAPAGGGTVGYIVNIVVKHNETAVAGAEVTIGETSVTTDDTGVASFASLPAGDYTVKIKAEDFEREQQITVEPAADRTSAQEFVIQQTTDTATTRLSTRTLAIMALVVVGIAAILFAVLQQRNRNRPSGSSGLTAATGQVFSNGNTAGADSSSANTKAQQPAANAIPPRAEPKPAPGHIEPVVIEPSESEHKPE